MADTLSIAPKPTVLDKIKQDIVETLREALAEAEKGEICSMLLIMKHNDNSWSDERSGSMDFPDAIGRLEIVKQNWIQAYLQGL
jgi:hypothetical protein